MKGTGTGTYTCWSGDHIMLWAQFKILTHSQPSFHNEETCCIVNSSLGPRQNVKLAMKANVLLLLFLHEPETCRKRRNKSPKENFSTMSFCSLDTKRQNVKVFVTSLTEKADHHSS